MARPPRRSERRAAWREARRTPSWTLDPERDVTIRDPKPAWVPLPTLAPIQAHALSKRRSPNPTEALAVTLGFNRDQRRSMKSRKGSRRMLEHGRATSTPAESFFFRRRTWNPHALRIEFRRRLNARVARYRAANSWHRRLPRIAWWCLGWALYRLAAAVGRAANFLRGLLP